MKKYLNTLVAVALTVALSATFASCGSDDDDPEPPAKEKTVKEATLTTYFYVNQAVLDTYEVTATSTMGEELEVLDTPVNITFADGSVQAMYPIKLEESSYSLPLSSHMSITFMLKDGYQVPESNNFAYASGAKAMVTYTDGTTQTYSQKGYTLTNNGVFGSKIDEYTTLINKNLGSVSATLTREGLELDK